MIKVCRDLESTYRCHQEFCHTSFYLSHPCQPLPL
jgi:hypothetical protein